MTKQIKKRYRKRQRGLSDANSKSHPTFVIGHFKQLLTQHKQRIGWLKDIKKCNYPVLTQFVLKLNSKLRSISVIRLCFIRNFGFKDGQQLYVKDLKQDNPHLQKFKKCIEGLTPREIEIQRAQNRLIFKLISPDAYRYYFSGQNNHKVNLKRHFKQQIKKGQKNYSGCTLQLQNFCQQLISGKIRSNGNKIQSQNNIENQLENQIEKQLQSQIQPEIENKRQIQIEGRNQAQSQRDINEGQQTYVSPFKQHNQILFQIVMEDEIYNDEQSEEVSQKLREDNQQDELHVPSQILTMKGVPQTSMDQISNLPNQNLSRRLSILIEDQQKLKTISLEKMQKERPKMQNLIHQSKSPIQQYNIEESSMKMQSEDNDFNLSQSIPQRIRSEDDNLFNYFWQSQ